MPTSRGRAELLARLATFTPARWPGEPLSALECARRGWRLEPGQLLRCVACQAAVPARLPGAGKPKLRTQCVERLQRLVAEGHRAGCRWAAGPLPAVQLRPPLAEPAAERRRVAEALARLTAASVQLPTSTGEQEPCLEAETAAALLTEALGADTPHDERALAALSYVLSGWELSSDERYLHCSFGCRTWDTSFSPAPEVASFSPAPEVASFSPAPEGTSFSPAPEVASISPAPETEKTPSAGADLIQNALDECGFNELDFDVGTPASAAGDTSGKDGDVSGDARVEGEEGSGDGRRDGEGEEAGSDNESESGPKGSPLSSNAGDTEERGMESMESSQESADVDFEVDVDSEPSASETGMADADHPLAAAAAGDDEASYDDGNDGNDDGDDDVDDREGSDVVVASSPDDGVSRERSTPDAGDPRAADSPNASAQGSPEADEAETPEDSPKDSPIDQSPVSPSLAESGSSRSEMSVDAASLTPTQQDGADQQTQDSNGDGGDDNGDGDASGGEEEEAAESASDEAPVPEEVSPVPSDVEIVSSASEASEEPPAVSVGDSVQSGSTAGSEDRAESREASPALGDDDGNACGGAESESAEDDSAADADMTADQGSSADGSSQDSNPEAAGETADTGSCADGSENDGSRADASPSDHSSEDADHSQTSPPPPPADEAVTDTHSPPSPSTTVESSVTEPSGAEPSAAEPSIAELSGAEPSSTEPLATADSAAMDSSPSPATTAATTAPADAEQRTPSLKRSADSAAAGSAAKRIRRRPAGPLEGHRCWCPWVAGVDGGQPGWRRAVRALMTTPAPCGERLWGEDDALDTMRRVWATLDQWTSPPAKPALRA